VAATSDERPVPELVLVRRDDARVLLVLTAHTAEAQSGADEGTAWGRVFAAVYGDREPQP
jgi:hypothetical protein